MLSISQKYILWGMNEKSKNHPRGKKEERRKKTNIFSNYSVRVWSWIKLFEITSELGDGEQKPECKDFSVVAYGSLRW